VARLLPLVELRRRAQLACQYYDLVGLAAYADSPSAAYKAAIDLDWWNNKALSAKYLAIILRDHGYSVFEETLFSFGWQEENFPCFCGCHVQELDRECLRMAPNPDAEYDCDCCDHNECFHVAHSQEKNCPACNPEVIEEVCEEEDTQIQDEEPQITEVEESIQEAPEDTADTEPEPEEVQEPIQDEETQIEDQQEEPQIEDQQEEPDYERWVESSLKLGCTCQPYYKDNSSYENCTSINCINRTGNEKQRFLRGLALVVSECDCQSGHSVCTNWNCINKNGNIRLREETARLIAEFEEKFEETQTFNEEKLQVEIPLPELPVAENRLQEIGNRIQEAIGTRYPMLIIEDSDPNGFANGEDVKVTTGAMAILDDDELAWLVCHEIIHNLKQHSAIRKQQNAEAFDAVVKSFQKSSGFISGIFSAIIVGAAKGASNRLDSQSREREADKLAKDMMKEAGFNPNKAVSAIRKIAPGADGGFFGTHPKTDYRERYLS